jgi:sugar transferase (PEP-CTERM system associated)
VGVAYVIFGMLPVETVRHEALQLAAIMSVAVLTAVRIYALSGGFGPMLVRRVMVLGTGDEADAVEKSMRISDVKVVGFYPLAGADALRVPRHRVLFDEKSLEEATQRLRVDEIIVAVGERRGGRLPVDELLACKLSGVRVLDLSSYFERALGQVRLDSLRASWLIFGDGFRQGAARTFFKRIFDITAAMSLLILSLPVMLVTAILVVLESGFPILYRQERVGQAGRIFKVIKFRSMRIDAEEDGRPRWASTNDERTTRTGRFIRKYRIDELPQLLNVIRGEMSLVGPRPERPFFVDKLSRDIPFYAARHSIKPGLTGWAQVRYHYGASAGDAIEKLQFDLYYVKNHTLFLDLVVLLETVVVVVTGKGAH